VNWMSVNVIVYMQTAKDFQFQVIHQGLFKDLTDKDQDKDKDKNLTCKDKDKD